MSFVLEHEIFITHKKSTYRCSWWRNPVIFSLVEARAESKGQVFVFWVNQSVTSTHYVYPLQRGHILIILTGLSPMLGSTYKGHKVRGCQLKTQGPISLLFSYPFHIEDSVPPSSLCLSEYFHFSLPKIINLEFSSTTILPTLLYPFSDPWVISYLKFWWFSILKISIPKYWPLCSLRYCPLLILR